MKRKLDFIDFAIFFAVAGIVVAIVIGSSDKPTSDFRSKCDSIGGEYIDMGSFGMCSYSKENN